jgi:pyruvate dehydrogenase E2 component (dihydrolipoamide acetyltransferase)
MSRDFKLPDLGEGLTEAEIVRVLVTEGEEIKEDQAVLLVETEKAQVELPSPFAGRLATVHVRAGQRVKVGTVLLSFADAGSAASSATPPSAPPARAAGPAPSAPAQVAATAPATGLPPAATPATRRLARELGVDLTGVRGTGPGGRIVDDDVRAAADGRAAAPRADVPGKRGPEVAATAPALAAPVEAPRPLAGPTGLPPLPRFEQWGPVAREPLRGIRRRSAEHLSLAWAVIPHVTQHDQADVTELETMRRRQQARSRETWGDLTLTVFLLKAVAIALRAHPRFNASLDHGTGELVIKRYYNIGVAVDTEQGLVVPVVRGVEGKALRDLAVELARLVTRTREGKATLEDLRGGTFTVTNTGGLGGTGATPIVNYP